MLLDNEYTRKKFNELESLAKPLQDWLVANYNPHCRIQIDYEGVEVLSGEMRVPMVVNQD